MSGTGYVGLGNMGGALARRLMAGREIHIFDVNPDTVREFATDGAIACGSLDDVAAQCPVIFLCLPTSAHVEQVLFGDNGLAKNLGAGSLIIDQTSGDPTITRAIAAKLEEQGVDYVDAPVSGGPQAALAGTIAIMVGASEAQYARALPYLAGISAAIFHAGPVGAGHVVKLVNNLLSCAQRLLSFEAISLAASCGVDARMAVDIIVAGGGRNAFLENVMASKILNGDLDTGFTLGLAHKDLKLACDLADDAGMPLAIGNFTRQLYQMCISEFGSQAKVDRAALLYDRWGGEAIVPAAGPRD